jgi:hypothetical protein
MPRPNKARKLALATAAGALLALACDPRARAEEFPLDPVAVPVEPAPLADDDFAALRSGSPFLRSLDLSQSLVLTGIATINGELVATLREREGKATHVVTGEANPKGWRMVGVEGDRAEPLGMAARISMEGGEVFSVRFDEGQTQPPDPRRGSSSRSSGGSGSASGSPSANYREGISGDGFRGAPPPDIVEKMSRMTTEQRDRLVTEIQQVRERNPNLSSEDRQMLFRRMVDRMAQQPRQPQPTRR